MKPLLLIDYDGTLCFDRFWRSIDPMLMAQIQGLLFTKGNPILDAWMRGKVTSEQINAWLAEKMSVPFEALWQVFVADCQKMTVRTELLQQIDTLRTQFVTVLLTDNMDCFTRFTVPALNLEEYFDDVLNSADHGVMKDDNAGDLFKSLASKYRVTMPQVWLLDNSTRACTNFAALGGNACLVTASEPVAMWLDKLSIKIQGNNQF